MTHLDCPIYIYSYNCHKVRHTTKTIHPVSTHDFSLVFDSFKKLGIERHRNQDVRTSQLISGWDLVNIYKCCLHWFKLNFAIPNGDVYPHVYIHKINITQQNKYSDIHNVVIGCYSADSLWMAI